VPFYQTVFYTVKNSGTKSLQDLKGRKIAFEYAGSTSGLPYSIDHFIPLGI